VVPTPTTQAPISTTVTSAPTTTIAPGRTAVSDPASFDPFGEGGENDQLAGNLLDGDLTTEWATETYLDPLELLKPGVGVTVRVVGSPQQLELVGLTETTDFEVLWSNELIEDPAAWERVAGASASPASTSIHLPARQDGFWLIWLTQLPATGEGYRASMAELRFSP
jgi:hypothetical protein